MPVAGKTKDEWVAQTFCDFGQPGRKTALANHFSIEAAIRRFKHIHKIYARDDWTCWQEDRAGNVINGARPSHA